MKAMLVLATVMTGLVSATAANAAESNTAVRGPGRSLVTCTAQGRFGGMFNGSGFSIPEATNNALAKCQQQGNPPCRIVRCN